MFRLIVAVLVAFGLGALIFGGVETAGAGLGLLLLAPLIFFFKVVLFVVLFGLFSRVFWGRGRAKDGPGASGRHRHHGCFDRRWSESGDAEQRQSADDRFEDWHRMAHAREEVESWTPDDA